MLIHNVVCVNIYLYLIDIFIMSIISIYYNRLARAIKEAEKSLRSVTCKLGPREAGGVVQSKPEDLRTGRVTGISPSPKAEDECLSSTVRQRKCRFSLLSLFVLFMPQWIG